MTKDQAIAQVLTTALDVAKKTGTWLQGQVPDVVHQLITFHIAVNVMQMTLATLWISAFAYAASRFPAAYEAGREAYDKRHRDWGSYDITDMPMGFVWTVGGMVGAVGAVVSIITLFSTSVDLVELLVAPKVWLLEYAAQLVK